MAQLRRDFGHFQAETSRLLDLVTSTATLAPAHQKLAAEIVHLRLSILLENQLKIIYCKIACGAPYLDGTAPTLLARQTSIVTAQSAMSTLNRPRYWSLNWNDGSQIRTNVEHVIDSTDHSVRTMLNFGSFLTEVRFIRNHIAHRNEGTRKNFKKLVTKYYGGAAPGVTAGTLLLSPRVGTPPLLRTHIVRARVLIKDLCKG